MLLSVGSKLVGMRRAHEISDRNGQFRVVGDHLGSTTLVVNTASPPEVWYREYYKPYGEALVQYSRWANGFTPTSVGFTGQRLDDETGR